MDIKPVIDFLPFFSPAAICKEKCRIKTETVFKRVGVISCVALTAITLCAIFFQQFVLIMLLSTLPAVTLIFELWRASHKLNQHTVKIYQEKKTIPSCVMTALRNHFSAIKHLCQKGADLNKQDENGRTLLHGMTEKKAVRLLVKHGASPYIREDASDRLSALEVAVKEGKEETVKIFLDNTKKLILSSICNIWNLVPNEKMVRFLYKEKSLQAHRHSLKPFLAIAKVGTRAMIEELIALKAHPNELDERKRNALHLCSSAHLVSTLIKAKVNIDHKDQQGHTPLMYHLKNMSVKDSIDHVGVALELVKCGADISHCSAPLVEVLKCGYVRKYKLLADLLLQKGAKASVANEQGDSALSLAQKNVKEGHPEYQEFLRKAKKQLGQ